MEMVIDRLNMLLHKFQKRVINPMLAGGRQKKLKYRDFTIISNNCWGGVCYEYLGMAKQSPTVGAYFFAEDYLKFCSRLRYYLALELDIIPISESRHYASILDKGNSMAIVGKLDDVEIVFLHYPNKEIVLEKWNKRVNRINWDRIILKFSYQNECNENLVKSFLEIEDYPKFVLVGKPITNHKDEIVFRRAEGTETVNETINFDRFIDPIKLINERL